MSLFFFAFSAAFAVQYQGTPVIAFRVDRPADDFVSGSVGFQKVRVHHCGGGHTDVTWNVTIDPIDVTTVPIAAGDHCALTFFWSTDLEIDGPGYSLVVEEDTTTVILDTPIDPEYLSSWTVTSGTMSGNGPWLLVDID